MVEWTATFVIVVCAIIVVMCSALRDAFTRLSQTVPFSRPIIAPVYYSSCFESR